jgi:hypothetical protein
MARVNIYSAPVVKSTAVELDFTYSEMKDYIFVRDNIRQTNQVYRSSEPLAVEYFELTMTSGTIHVVSI